MNFPPKNETLALPVVGLIVITLTKYNKFYCIGVLELSTLNLNLSLDLS